MFSDGGAIVALMSNAAVTSRIRYELRDRAGDVPAVHVRVATADGGKLFLWEQADGTPGLRGRPVASLPLYGIWRLAQAPHEEPVYVTEGEKAADALAAIGLLGVGTVTGAGGTPDDEVLSSLAARDVRLWPDNDEVGRAHMDRVAVRLVELGASVSILAWLDAPEHGDAADYLDAGHTFADVKSMPILSGSLATDGWAERNPGALVHSAQGASPRRKEPNPQFRTAREFASGTAPDVDWIAPPWVAAGAITGVDGKVKVAGKTTLVTHLCRAVLDGRPFLDQPTRRTAVVYLTEQPPASLRETLRRADLLERDDFAFLCWRDSVGLPWARIVEIAVAECQLRGAGLLVVDTLGRFAGIRGDGENSAGEAEAAMAPLQIAAADGLAVIVVRHERKTGGDVGDSGRGSSAFGGAVDIVMAVRRRQDRPTTRLIQAVSRFDETPETLAIELIAGGYVSLGVEPATAHEMAKGRVLETLATGGAAGLTLEALVDRVLQARTTVQRAIDELSSERRVVRKGGGVKGDPFRFALVDLNDPSTVVDSAPAGAVEPLRGVELLADLFRNLGPQIDSLGDVS